MKRLLAILPACVVLASGGCLAAFDMTVRDFVEGPLLFHVTRDSLDVPTGALIDDPAGCTVSELGCADIACLEGPGACNPDGMCRPQAKVLLSHAVDLAGRYSIETIRVDSVRVTGINVSVVSSTLSTGLSRAKILWAPTEAASNLALTLADLGTLEAGTAAGPRVFDLVDEGVDSLEIYLTQHQDFRLYLEAETYLEPGAECPTGSFDIQVELGMQVHGEDSG